mmetsp:Transcript_20979/g.31816  ORF Transcript_20979/g.31816 Transcript_20979/m.31816 type:complete len:370 (-) Transcript_20979:134-1243(-)|eukprot:CAMPEP_0194226622 /NCGR_PEP_ID=MMETSP0156-20130528/42245_1 /TAXON_ID=33649 /ORGANISM="Thalassionema nitzschioides, Strain L26-B" /LENGTH=369 /DNA_ID=CAMNT_0038959045 /DNA_START=138 /DNA_END=1247 /DNA_ORIENTATION=-
MVAGLGFLSKKSFNPKNLSNQKSVWEARQSKLADEKAARERAQQLQREQEEEELARVRHGTSAGNKTQLKFMYAVPPGLVNAAKNEKGNNNQKQDSNNLTPKKKLTALRQPGDDDAAAAFRAMLASHNKQNEETVEDQAENTEYAFSNSSGAALQGSTIERAEFDFDKDGRSALEKAVGRKDGGGALTLEEQVARFPQLKNAPMVKGMSATDVQVNFKPLGTQLRNVRCMACGVWGHSRGERECAKSGWDPFQMTTKPTNSIMSKISAETSKTTTDSSRLICSNAGGEKEGRRDISNSDEIKEKRRYDSDGSSSYERRRKRREKKKKKRRRKEKRHRRNENSRKTDDEHDKRRRKRRRYDSSSPSEDSE